MTKARSGVHIYGLFNDGKVSIDRTWDQPEREMLFFNLRDLHHRLVVATGDAALQPWEYTDAIKEINITARRVRGAFRRIENKYQQWKKEQDMQLLQSLFSKPSASQKSKSGQ